MLNENLLRAKIIERGYSMKDISANLSVEPSTLYRKLKGKSEFDRDEINQLKTLLTLSADELDQIFFG